MTQRPIGVFDSGVGGLSVLDALVKTLPNEHFVYVGDTAHMPYGERSPEDIKRLVHGIERFLIDSCNAKMLVVACNTSAGILADYWQNGCSVPVVEPVLPISNWLKLQDKKQYQRIGLLATQGTINSGRYQQMLEQNGFEVFPVSCTGFAKLVEDNQFATPQGQALLKTFLEPLVEKQVDAIILGCTHYPFALEVLRRIWDELSFDKKVEWLDPALWMAVETEGLAVIKNKAENQALMTAFYVTGSSEDFDRTANALKFKTLMPLPSKSLAFPIVAGRLS